MASVSCALLRIKQDLQPFLSEESIMTACRQIGHAWRDRQLGPVRTIHLFILQVLCFNTAMTHLRHLAKQAVNAPAYCKARMRLPLAVLQSLLGDSSRAMRHAINRQGLWCGLRAYLVDGSSTIAPDTPSSRKAFGQPKGCKKGCGFPVPKVLGLFDAYTGMIVEALSFPLYTHEQSQVWRLHPLLGAGDLLVGDRGFCSYAHLALLSLRNVCGLFRMHQIKIVDFRPHRRTGGKGRPSSTFVRRLGRHDQIVRWARPGCRPKWMSKKQWSSLPASLLVREVRYQIPRKGQRTECVTLATTLLDPKRYPKEKIAELYGIRWTVETHFAELKTTLKMRKVKSKTAIGVQKELAVYCLVYNLIHLVMIKAARRQKVTPDRVSFIDTARWLLSAQPGEPMPDLAVNPWRPGRHEPRVVKDQQDTYTKMCRPRHELRKALKKQVKGA
jgi:Transposase DDE domain